MSKKPILVTAALIYVNNLQHLGNIIGSTLSSDVYSRYQRNRGENVLHLSGVDCYGTTTEIKAKLEGLTCEQLCDKYQALQKEIYDWFNIQFDVWGKTSTTTQTELVQDVFSRLHKNDHVEKKISKQMHCSECDMFLADRYLKGGCYTPDCLKDGVISNGDQCDKCCNLINPEKLIAPYCLICNTKSQLLDTEHYYLKLGDFQQKLIDHYITNENVNMNETAKSITIGWLNKKLESRCITRDLKWGVPVSETYIKDKVFYVWFEAPLAYYSILKNDLKYGKDMDYWLSGKIVQFYGKDNTPHHTVMWGATLMGSDNIYPIPTQISCTEYLDYEGKKFSKSNNVGIFGDQVKDISQKLGINEDYWRFYLIKIRPENRDTSFTWDDFLGTIRGDLCYNIGNLINRSVSLSTKFCNNQTHYKHTLAMNDVVLNEIEFDTNMQDCKLKGALQNIINIGYIGNKMLQDTKPWILFKQEETKQQGNEIMGQVNMICYTIIRLLKCITPRTSEQLLKHFTSTSDNLLSDSEMTININGYIIPFKLLTKDDLKVLNVLNV